ncbi:hypothetical protein [Hymenobacter sp. BRD67]|uniref:hypothetical protein n=1 Tax=Hymenobacter sp. BRD67 TaxID=2675877 RepID=UPI0020B6942A|nr:hypothetical protein [Hymenobacter sp. BRD67]
MGRGLRAQLIAGKAGPASGRIVPVAQRRAGLRGCLAQVGGGAIVRAIIIEQVLKREIEGALMLARTLATVSGSRLWRWWVGVITEKCIASFFGMRGRKVAPAPPWV